MSLQVCGDCRNFNTTPPQKKERDRCSGPFPFVLRKAAQGVGLDLLVEIPKPGLIGLRHFRRKGQRSAPRAHGRQQGLRQLGIQQQHRPQQIGKKQVPLPQALIRALGVQPHALLDRKQSLSSSLGPSHRELRLKAHGLRSLELP